MKSYLLILIAVLSFLSAFLPIPLSFIPASALLFIFFWEWSRWDSDVKQVTRLIDKTDITILRIIADQEEVTIGSLARDTGLSWDAARKRLTEMAERGLATIHVKGNPPRAYFKLSRRGQVVAKIVAPISVSESRD